MSGLQRRRVPGAASNGTGGGSAAAASPRTSADEPTHTVGYDPADTTRRAEAATRPLLTLMEEVLLMGLKDQQGYLSFWNDSISYVLRGCILMELALQGKIQMVADPARRRVALSDRIVEVINDEITGEVLLDETLKIMKASEPLSVGSWVDYLSGETWNITKIAFQLKQVRERLAKGLVDKGILRTEKRNFFLFDMATHPVADASAKDDIRRRVLTVLTANTIEFTPSKYSPAALPMRYLRTVALVGSAHAANVLENVMGALSYDARDMATLRADELLSDYSEYPFEQRAAGWAAALHQAVDRETQTLPGAADPALQLEIVAAVFSVYSQLDRVL